MFVPSTTTSGSSCPADRTGRENTLPRATANITRAGASNGAPTTRRDGLPALHGQRDLRRAGAGGPTPPVPGVGGVPEARAARGWGRERQWRIRELNDYCRWGCRGTVATELAMPAAGGGRRGECELPGCRLGRNGNGRHRTPAIDEQGRGVCGNWGRLSPRAGPVRLGRVAAPRGWQAWAVRLRPSRMDKRHEAFSGRSAHREATPVQPGRKPRRVGAPASPPALSVTVVTLLETGS